MAEWTPEIKIEVVKSLLDQLFVRYPHIEGEHPELHMCWLAVSADDEVLNEEFEGLLDAWMAHVVRKPGGQF